MRIELCSFSGYKIYPGHGRRVVRVDGKTYNFFNSKCERSHKLKRNPRETRWTVLYRRKYKKGQHEDMKKKRTKRNVKFQRAIVGLSLTEIMAKRSMKPEVRKAQREEAIRAAKERQKAKALKKGGDAPKAAAAKAAAAKPKAKAAKPVQTKQPRVGGKR